MASLLASLLCFLLLSTFASFSTAYYVSKNEDTLVGMTFKLKERIQEKAMTVPYSETENPAFLNRMNVAMESLQTSVPKLYQSLPRTASSLCILLIYIGMMMTFQPLLLLLLGLNLLCSAYAAQRARRYEFEQREKTSEVNRKKQYSFQLMSDYSYGKDVRNYLMKDWLLSIFDHYKTEGVRLCRRICHKQFGAAFVDILFTFVRELGVYLLLCWMYVSGGLTIDNFVLYVGVVASFAVVSEGLLQSFSDLYAAMKNFGEYRRFAAEDPPASAGSPLPGRSRGTLEFQDVSFQYPNSETEVLKHFTYTLDSGKHVALVGLNGAGKTTLIKLICRFYENYSGRILLDGTEIREIGKEDYYRALSAVFQDSKLLAATVAENLALSQEKNERRLESVIKEAGLEEKLSSFPKGMETELTKLLFDDGVELSGGEKQKLMLARAMYHGGSLLLLDEPTAALDALAEYEIYQNFAQLSEGKSVIFISHRLNSTRFCDEILLLENGEIVERGTHEELFQLNRKYATLYRTQAQYYTEEAAL